MTCTDVGDKSLVLTWTPGPVTEEHDSEPISYLVESMPALSTAWVPLSPEIKIEGSIVKCVLDNLTPNQGYAFRVTAVNVYGKTHIDEIARVRYVDAWYYND